LKVAKQDAQTVINMVRTEKEAAFLSRSNQPLDNDKLLDMKKTTHAEVKTMTKHFESNKAASIAMLIEVTTNVSMTLEETRKLSGQRANAHSY